MDTNDVQDRPAWAAHQPWLGGGAGMGRAAEALRPRSPYRIGDAVLGDDPFNGRHEGTVVTQEGTTVGVETVRGLFFYDHRQLRRLD